MKVLVACEYSGRVRDAFLAAGHDAMSCDLLETDSPGPHYTGDISDVLYDGWDLMVAHPPCTFLTCSAEWAYKNREDINKKLSPDKLYGADRRVAREEAAKFFLLLAQAPIARIAMENPVGVMSTRYRKPDQYIQPYEYGHDASKRTCLWLTGLPPLQPTKAISPRMVKGLPRWSNQTDSGQNREPPSADRWKVRSTTWAGWAEAMASQWGRTAG